MGSSVIAKGGATVGFQMATQGADPEADKYSRVRSLVRRKRGGLRGVGRGGAGRQANKGSWSGPLRNAVARPNRRRRLAPRLGQPSDSCAAALPALQVLEELKAYFRPELLNRMDEVVVFRQLGPAQVRTTALFCWYWSPHCAPRKGVLPGLPPSRPWPLP